MMLLLAILLGGFFGFSLYKVGATKMENLLSMLSLRDLTLMKIILFAIGFSSVLVGLSYAMNVFDPSHLSVKTMHLGVVVGGLIFGLAFGTIGTCPGTCIAGVMGGGFKKAISGVCGGLVGAFLFSMSYGWLLDKGFFNVLNLGKLTLFNLSDKYPSIFDFGYGGLASVGIIFMVVAFLLPMRGFKK